MAFIEPMHRNKPNITYLLDWLHNGYSLDKFFTSCAPSIVFTPLTLSAAWQISGMSTSLGTSQALNYREGIPAWPMPVMATAAITGADYPITINVSILVLTSVYPSKEGNDFIVRVLLQDMVHKRIDVGWLEG